MSDGRKRLSGAQYRKRKLEKEEDKKRLAGSLKTFFVSTTNKEPQPSSSQDPDIQRFESNEGAGEPLEKLQKKSKSDAEVKEEDTLDITPENIQTEAIVKVDGEVLVLKDPACWPQVLTDNIRMSILDIGPVQLKNIVYPVNDSNRSFCAIYFEKKLSNNEKVPRTWLVYSKSKNSVYCFCCTLFKVSVNSFNDGNGYSDWRHLSRNLERHETSKGHFESVRKWVELKKSIGKGVTVDSINQNIIQMEKKDGHLF